jgi:hypothetical protein
MNKVSATYTWKQPYQKLQRAIKKWCLEQWSTQFLNLKAVSERNGFERVTPVQGQESRGFQPLLSTESRFLARSRPLLGRARPPCWLSSLLSKLTRPNGGWPAVGLGRVNWVEVGPQANQCANLHSSHGPSLFSLTGLSSSPASRSSLSLFIITNNLISLLHPPSPPSDLPRPSSPPPALFYSSSSNLTRN